MTPHQANALRVLCERLAIEQDPTQWKFFRATLDELLSDVRRHLPNSR